MQVSKSFSFDAAHILSRHPGKCSRLHGHTYTLTVTLEGSVQKETGFVLDYTLLKEAVEPLVKLFDHRLLNCFVKYPSAENIAVHVANWTRNQIQFEHIDRLVVTVQETEGTSAVWDSKNREDFAMLDDHTEEAEWREPSIGIPVGGPSETYLERLKAHVDQLFARSLELYKTFEAALIQAEQTKLYYDSLDPKSVETVLDNLTEETHAN